MRLAGVEVASRFLIAVDEAYQQLFEHPHVGATVKAFEPRLAALRFWPLPGLASYFVFHVPSPDVVDVVRVLHGVRDPARLIEEEPRID